MTSNDPYDEVPYRSLPIEWTAPERLTLASMLHGGPRPSLRGYRVLELGCADGANLLPQAYYRGHSTFVGIDGAASQIANANAGKSTLGLTNVEFIHCDFRAAAERLEGQFDYIIGHGVFSWVSPDVRDALLELCAARLRHGGLLYLNYNALPGWNVRGMVRGFLMAETAGMTDLRARARRAQEAAADIAAAMAGSEHPYSRLLVRELNFICEHDLSYIAHEYLTAENHAYWRSEFLSLAARYGLAYVADADFSYSSGRIPADLPARLVGERIVGRDADDTVDFLCYRQLHSPVLTACPFEKRALHVEEFAGLVVASALEPSATGEAGNVIFVHASGYQVEAKDEVMRAALETLLPLWPRGLAVGALFRNVDLVRDDLMLLHRNGLIELRCSEPEEPLDNAEPLRQLEGEKDGYFTTAYHTRQAAVA